MSDPKTSQTPPVAEAPAPAATHATKPATKVAAKPTAKAPARPGVKKVSRLEETKARNKKALADALALAKAVKIPPPSAQPMVPLAGKKAGKMRKPKLVRATFTMPAAEFDQIAALKKRLASLGGDVKKSELLRAGIGLLAGLENKELAAVMARVERVKTGRPKK